MQPHFDPSTCTCTHTHTHTRICTYTDTDTRTHISCHKRTHACRNREEKRGHRMRRTERSAFCRPVRLNVPRLALRLRERSERTQLRIFPQTRPLHPHRPFLHASFLLSPTPPPPSPPTPLASRLSLPALPFSPRPHSVPFGPDLTDCDRSAPPPGARTRLCRTGRRGS